MEYLVWSERFSVGVEELDAQHRTLFTLINDLQTGIVFSKGRDAVAEALRRMTDYVHEHFSTEEEYMLQYGFPGLEQHRAKHADFVDETLAFAKRFAEDDDDGLADVILRFLRDWLVNHILHSDRQYARFFRMQPDHRPDA